MENKSQGSTEPENEDESANKNPSSDEASYYKDEQFEVGGVDFEKEDKKDADH